MKTRNLIGFMLGLVAIALFAAWMNRAEATEPKPATTTQSQNMTQQQNTSASSSSVSEGGDSSLYDSTTTRTIAVGTTSPAPLHATPQCYLPPKGIRRVRQALFGVVTLDPLLVRDEQCMQDIADARAHELAVLEAQANLERIRAERLVAECAVRAGREEAACSVSK
jgi:hypothetical protein